MIPNESTISRLLKLAPGQRTDEALYYMLAPHLLGFWTFLRPRHAGQEIGDVLFAFGDVCFIFEAKTRDKFDHTSERWIQSKLKEAATQIATNYRKLSSGKIPYVSNTWRGRVEWASLGIKYYHGVIVMTHNSEPYDPRDISSDIFEHSPTPLHVISLWDMGDLMRLMNTPWDFVVYWEFRHSIGGAYTLPVHQESGIYWRILENWVELARGQGTKRTDDYLLNERRFLEDYTRTVMKEGHVAEPTKKAVAASYLLDLAAGSVIEKAEKDGSGERVGSERHNMLVKAVEQIAAIDRRRRAVYGELWVECASKCITLDDDTWVHSYSPSRNISYVLNARPSAVLNETHLINKMKEQMIRDGSARVLGLSATAVNIFATRDDLLSIINGRSTVDTGDELLLNTTAALIERT